MLKNSFLNTILKLCKKYKVESHSYKKGDIVIDTVFNSNLYVFATGGYTVWSQNVFGGIHQVGEIYSPSVVGEGIFFGEFQKPVRIVTEARGKVYVLSETTIAKIGKSYPSFHEILMRACLAVTNERIREANTERILGYTLNDVLETRRFENIHTLLSILKKTFSLHDVIWIERHEVLTDIFAVKYRESSGNIPVNERITLECQNAKGYTVLSKFEGRSYAHVFPLRSHDECFGFIILMTDSNHLPGFIARIMQDLTPNFIRIIESLWKDSKR